VIAVALEKRRIASQAYTKVKRAKVHGTLPSRSISFVTTAHSGSRLYCIRPEQGSMRHAARPQSGRVFAKRGDNPLFVHS
jgi:hypothetical protein